MTLGMNLMITGCLGCAVAVVMVSVIKQNPSKPQLTLLALLAYGGFAAVVIGALMEIWG